MREEPASAAPRAMRADGFTLVETVVALGVLIALLAGLAGVWTMTAGATVSARHRTLAVQLARDKLEQLASLTWSVWTVGPGTDVIVSDTTTDTSRQPATSTGYGTSPSPDDSLAISRATYVDYLDAQGEWLGTGPDPPPRTRFVRRWWIARTGPDPSALLLFQVMVAPLTTVARAPAGTWWRQHPDAVWLSSAKLRRHVPWTT